MHLIRRVLHVRAEFPEAFFGSYEPLDLGPGVCAFVRGGEVLVAAAVRPDTDVVLPDGWHDVLGVDGVALAVR